MTIAESQLRVIYYHRPKCQLVCVFATSVIVHNKINIPVLIVLHSYHQLFHTLNYLKHVHHRFPLSNMANAPHPGKPLMTNPPPWKSNSQLDNNCPVVSNNIIAQGKGDQHAWNRSFSSCLQHIKLLVSYSRAFDKRHFPMKVLHLALFPK